MDKQNKNLENTLDSERFESDISNRLTSSGVCANHLRNCGYKYKTCICDHLIKLAEVHDKRLAKSSQNISQSCDSFHSIILAGSERCFSQKSSENSFHSAESTIATTKLPITLCEQSSIIFTENSLKNNTELKEIKNSLAESCSSNDVLNTNINEKFKISRKANTSGESDIDLNQAQNLFKSASSHNRNTNNNVDGSVNISNSLLDDENLRFLLDNHSTTLYNEIPQFLKSYSALSHNESDDTSKEVTRRLTRSFYQNPQEFAKRLMTIIEESETNYDLEYSAISVNKLTAAFLKMCKYVEDESMPSMCDKTLPDHHEATQMPFISPTQDNTTKYSLSQGTSTPIYPSTVDKKLIPKISPLGKKKNILNIQNSPLYISTLTRAAGSPKTPIILESPGSTSGSAPNHNDSSFTFWEKKFKARPLKKNNNSAPILTDEDVKRIAKSEEQLRKLQATDSPSKSPIKAEINIYNIHCDMQNSESKLRVNLEFLSESTEDTRSDASLEDDKNDMTESILYELAEKRKRCFETEKTIRQIDAESSAYSNSTQTSENEKSVKIVEYLNSLRNGADYQKIVMNDKIELSQNCNDSEIDSRLISQNPPICRNESQKLTDKRSNNLIITQSNLQQNITMRKPLRTQTPHKKSVDVNILQSELSGDDSKSSKSSIYIKSPALMSRRVVSPSMILRSISPIDRTSISESSISASILQSKKTPRSLKSPIHTPRAISPNLNVYPLSSYKSKSRLCNKARVPSSITTSSSSNAQKTSKTLSTVKLLTGRKSTVQLLQSNKGFTLEYMNSILRSRSPHGINHGALSKVTKPQNENKHCPNIFVTPSTSLENICKNTQHNGILKEKNTEMPMSSGQNRGGKFFNTPGKTPIPKIRPKPTSFFSLNDVRKPILKSPYITRNYSPSEVKSPVAEYIYGTDTTLIQNIRGKKNENLLTPKKKKDVCGQLKFKATGKNNMDNKSKKNPIFNYKIDSISDVNEENINDTSYNHPKVSYQLPSVIHEIKTELNTPRGSRARRLMEANDSRVIIKHAGRAIPRIRDVTQLDTSIHIPKSAEKQKFVFQPNNTKYQQ